MELIQGLIDIVNNNSTSAIITTVVLAALVVGSRLLIKFAEVKIENMREHEEQKEKLNVAEIEEMVSDAVEEIDHLVDEKLSLLQKEHDDFYKGKLIGSKRVPLTEHPIFSELRDMDLFFLIHLKVEDEGRRLLIQEKVIKKIRLWYKIIYKMAEDLQNCIECCEHCDSYSSCGNAQKICADTFIEGIQKYRESHKLETVSLNGIRYDDESMATMEIYSNKFNEYHSISEQLTSDSIDRIFKSIAYRNCYFRSWDVLTAYLYAFSRVKLDCGTAISSLNGELTGHKFLGITVGEYNCNDYER